MRASAALEALPSLRQWMTREVVRARDQSHAHGSVPASRSPPGASDAKHGGAASASVEARAAERDGPPPRRTEPVGVVVGAALGVA